MIQISNTLRRNTLTPALSALVAAGLLATASNAQAAKADQRVLDAVAAAATQDIEAIAPSAGAVADQIGTGAIKMSGKNIKTLGAGMSDAIIAKVSANPPNPADRNRLENKIDEVGEVGAEIMKGLTANAKFAKLGKAKKATLTLLKAVYSTAKKTSTFVGTHFFTDVAAGIAQTISNGASGVTDVNEEKIQKFLVKKSKSIGGKTNRDAVLAGINQGFDDPVISVVKREDGNIAALSEVADAETDFRNGA